MSDSKSKYEEIKESGHVFWEEQELGRAKPNWMTMEPRDRLKIFEEVNTCETLTHLARIIESLADEDGLITGRNKKFDAKRMAYICRAYDDYPRNSLTREFGIRQQAMHILYYNPPKGSLKS